MSALIFSFNENIGNEFAYQSIVDIVAPMRLLYWVALLDGQEIAFTAVTPWTFSRGSLP